MILRANIRGNGGQLGWYLNALQDNDRVEILEVNGREDADSDYLKQTVLDMQLMAELTKSPNAFFNLQINPAYGEDRAMTREDWYKAADILAKETGYEHQRRVIVLHTKKGRTHAHVVWERYNHETGKMVDNKHSRLKVDHARPKIEKALNQQETPRRNNDKNAIKAELTAIWDKTGNGPDFVLQAQKSGYVIAAGTGNRPFMVVDKNGRAFDLVRQINGVRTKDVRARLRNEPLITDKKAIEFIRNQSNEESGKREKQTEKQKTGSAKPAPPMASKARDMAIGFADNREDTIKPDAAEMNQRRQEQAFAAFSNEIEEIAGDKPSETAPINPAQQRKEAIAGQFAENDLDGKNGTYEQEQELQKVLAEQERQRVRKLIRKRHR